MTRQCGSCTACCTALNVLELQKEPGIACEYLVPIGPPRGPCSVYSERPPSCSAFECLWLQGYFQEGERPDRVGVVFWVPPPESLPPQVDPEKIVFASEVRLGAAAADPGLEMIERIQDQVLVVIFPFGQTKVEIEIHDDQANPQVPR